MFPEFMAIDLTFGTNRERRPLLLVIGIDGSNHAFSICHVFLIETIFVVNDTSV